MAQRIHLLLRQAIGLDPASVGAEAIARAVQERQAALGLPDADAYWQRLSGSPAELQQLVDAVLVPETWFFRGPEAFAALAQLAGARRARRPGLPLRLLSLPCSSGEEAYSIAMALFDAGLPAAAFQVDAVDVCTRSLQAAHTARYGANSFRGKHLEFRARHFQREGERYQVSEPVRRQVRFLHGNIFDPDLLAAVPPYDVVFCRNMLIYFDRDMQERAIARLGRLLRDDGILFAGPAEGGPLVRQGMVPAGIAQAFVFFKPEAAQPSPPPAAPAALARPARRAPPLAPAAPAAPPSLEAATRLANRGLLAEAEVLCRQHLEQCGPSAAAYCLLGVLSDAGGDAGAAREHYRRALYLEPGHEEALAHLSGLLAMQGDSAGAQRLAGRARRSRKESA